MWLKLSREGWEGDVGQSLEETLPDVAKTMLDMQEESRAGLSWEGKPLHTPFPEGTIRLTKHLKIPSTMKVADYALFFCEEKMILEERYVNV